MNCASDTRRQATKTWTAPEARLMPSLWLCLGLCGSFAAQSNAHNISIVSALLAYSYTDAQTGELVQTSRYGLYGAGSVLVNGSGYLVHVRVNDNGSANNGCTPYVNSPTATDGPWISLVRRGGCKFQKKVDMALSHNASAIVIYNHEPENTAATVRVLFVIETTTIATVFIRHSDGTALAELVDNGTMVYLTILVGSQDIIQSNNDMSGAGPTRHNTAVLLIFIGFLIVGLIVVVVYAVRHAKYVHARNQAAMAMSVSDTQQAHDILLNNENHVQRPQGTPDQLSQPLILQLQHQQWQQSHQPQPPRPEPCPRPAVPPPGPAENQGLSPVSDPHDQSQNTALLSH